MRDIRGDLRERAKLIERAIITEENRCKRLVDQLKRERDGKLQNLKVQLEAVNRLAEVAAWQYAARVAVAAAIRTAGAATDAITQFSRPPSTTVANTKVGRQA
jgi:hypothetical protein